MTSIVGILCKDGVVIATDSSATFVTGQQPTVEQQFEKIDIVGDRVIVAGTGQIGLGQRFCAIVKKAWEDKVFSSSPIEISKKLTAATTQDFGQTGVKQGSYGALVAFPSEHRHHLCEFSVHDFQPELKTDKLWYVSMGSAQPITDTFLGFIREVFWNDGMPNLHDGIFAATWILDYAVKVNAGGVNAPVRISVLEDGKKGQSEARLLSDDELGEHRQNIDEAKHSLRDFKLKHQLKDQEVIPEIPETQKE